MGAFRPPQPPRAMSEQCQLYYWEAPRTWDPGNSGVWLRYLHWVGRSGEEGLIMGSHDQGTLEPEEVERKIWQYLLILDQAAPEAITPGLLNMGAKKSIFCLRSRILLLAKEAP